MKKMLVLNYYWPPSGGAGVQRWVRFCKTLKNHGWKPTLYAPENATYLFFDYELTHQVSDIRVIRRPILEPHVFFSKLTGTTKEEARGGYKMDHTNMSIINKIGWFIRGNFFIPDSRCLWIKPSIRYLSQLLERESFEVIVSSGPPHSLHLIASALKKKYNIPWIADFRDPWLSMEYYQKTPLTSMAHRIHSKLEKKCVTEPDEVIVVGKASQQEFEKKYNRKINLIYNGYDDLIPSVSNVILDKKFTIVHIGSSFPQMDCSTLWNRMGRVANRNAHFKKHLEIKLIGHVAEGTINAIHQQGMGDELTHINYIPFLETQHHLFSAQLLLLIVSNKTTVPGKLFEYLKSSRPILLIGPPDGDTATILTYCEAGYVSSVDDGESIERILTTCFDNYMNHTNYICTKNVEDFSSTRLTEKLASLLTSVRAK